MIHLVVSPRSGQANTAHVCEPCCCQFVTLNPGEMNLLRLDYGPWAGPLRGRGLIAGTTWDVTHDTSACPTTVIDGFGPPDNQNVVLTTGVGVPVSVDLSLTALPPGNTFSFSILPLAGPEHGTVTVSGTVVTYTPLPGWTGRAYFSYRMTDAQNRSIVRHVRIDVGSPTTPIEWWRSGMVPALIMERAHVSRGVHQLSVPIWMPWSCRACDRFRLTIRQPYEDCDGNLLWHIECIDVSCAGCG